MKKCLESELKKKAVHLEWEREAEKRRRRKEELDKELQRQVKMKRGWGEEGQSWLFRIHQPAREGFKTIKTPIIRFSKLHKMCGACHNEQIQTVKT